MSWFKNLQVYRLRNLGLAAPTVARLEEMLKPQSFAPCGSQDFTSMGWVALTDDAQLVHVVNRQMFLSLKIEQKVLPPGVVKAEAKKRAEELEEQQDFPPGRKQMRELIEQVTNELLPRAFSKYHTTRVWIDPVNDWLCVDAASMARAEDVLKLLFKAIPKFPLETLRTVMSPGAAMTDWLASDEAPHGFTVDQDTELQARSEGKATVRYLRHTLDAAAMRDHVEAGKQCTRLALTWADKISFVLTDGLVLKSVAPLDVLKEDVDLTGKNDRERLDGDLLLMSGELAKMLEALVDALGGELKDKD